MATIATRRPATIATGSPSKGRSTPKHPANFVLTQCVSMNDPGLLVLPTHRLFRGVQADELRPAAVAARRSFETRTIARGRRPAPSLWEDLEIAGEQGRLAFYTAEDDTWTHAAITPQGIASMARARQRSQRRLARPRRLDPASPGDGRRCCGTRSCPSPCTSTRAEEVAEALRKGDAVGRDATGQMGAGGRFELACLVMPATVDHVRAISEHGERMPAKSTYFYPKLLGGMVVHLLE